MGVLELEREQRARSNTQAHTQRKNTHMHCNCPCYSGALSCIVQLWSRINGGRGIRVNLLGTHGPGFVSKPHFGFVEENGNDMGAKQEKGVLFFSCFFSSSTKYCLDLVLIQFTFFLYSRRKGLMILMHCDVLFSS